MKFYIMPGRATLSTNRYLLQSLRVTGRALFVALLLYSVELQIYPQNILYF